MIFKRPKTTNNFFLYEKIAFLRTAPYIDSPVEQEIEKFTDRDEKVWKDAWEEYLDNPLNFWTLIIILERITYKESQILKLPLSNFGNPIKNPQLFEKFDRDIYSEIHGQDYSLIDEASFQFTAYRIAEACGLFLSFDIKQIFFENYTEDIFKEKFQKVLAMARESSKYGSESDQDYFMSQVHYLQLDYSGRSIYGEGEGYEVIPDSDDADDDFHSILHLLGDYLAVGIEIDKNNASELHKYIYNRISFDCSFNRDLYLAKIIQMISKCEVIGMLLRIPSRLILDADFPLIQFIWYLSLDDRVYVFDWKIDDYLDISIGAEPSLLKAIGINTESTTENLAYNEQKEVLDLNGTKLSLGETNEGFVKEYFDLLFDAEGGVSIDEIIERLEPNIWELGPDKIPKAKKKLSYDRVNLLNKKIAKLTGVSGLFKIENGYIKLTSPIRVEKLSKALEK